MTQAIDTYLRLNTALARLCLVISCLGVAFAIFALTMAALERYFFGFGYAMLNDLPPLLMPWVVFPMMGVLLRGDRHITVDLLPSLLSGPKRHGLDLAIGLIVLIASLWFLWGGIDALRFFMGLNQTTETGIRFPLWWIYLSFPVGFGILAWFALERILAGGYGMATGRALRPDEGGSA